MKLDSLAPTVMKLPRLSASISEDSFGFVVLVRKTAGSETEMFKLYDKEVTLPYISNERFKIAKIDDDRDAVPDFLHAVISTDGGMTQMMALQDIDSLKEKKRRNIDQVKFAKKTSGVVQPSDVGDLHPRQRHHAKHTTLEDVPRMCLLNPAAEQIQEWRDIEHLNINGKTVENILNMIIRMPTILQKSSGEKSNRRSFFISGITDSSQQGTNVDRIMATCKKKLRIELKQQLLDEASPQIKEFRNKGKFVEEYFDEFNQPVDTDSAMIEHPLSESFALQHHRQRYTNMTNSQVMGDFTEAFAAADPSAVVQGACAMNRQRRCVGEMMCSEKMPHMNLH